MWMNQKYSSICCLLVLQIINISEENLIITPSSQVVQREDTARFNCSTDLQTHGIKWIYWYVGAVKPYNVYIDGRFMNGYANNTRYGVDASEIGRFDLVITNVQLHDAGRFDCVENIPSGDMSSADLTVKERDGELIVTPSATAVFGGQPVRLTCLSSHKKNVWWKLIRAGSLIEYEVYMGASGFVNGFLKSGRFSLDLDDNIGRYDLLIGNVQPSDAGRFICIDKGGLGQQRSAELTVVDFVPRCSSNIPITGTVGENACGIEPDQVSMFCHVNFTGNIAPGLEWINARTGLAINEGYFFQNTRTTSVNLTMKMKASRQTSWTDFVCRIAGIHYTNQDNCSPISVPVNHIDLSHTTKLLTTHYKTITCRVNSTDSCRYSWIKRNDDGEVLIVSGATLDLSDVGLYSCKADCAIRGTTCTVYPISVEFQSPSEDFIPVKFGVLIGCVSVFVVIAFFIIGFIFILRRNGPCFRFRKSKVGKVCKLPSNASNTKLKSFAVIGENIYAVHEKSNVVSAFITKSSCKFVRNFKIPDLKSPEDIVGSATQNCLFISDSESLCVWKVSLSDRHDASHQKFTEHIYPNPTHRLALTPTGNVMMVYQKNDVDATNNIVVYDKAGLPSKIVKLKNENDELCHAVMTEENNYVVSFGGRLGMVDKYENVVKSYPMRDNPPFPTEQFGEIFFDGNRLIYVLDCTNFKILILTTDLIACDAIDLSFLDHTSELLQKVVVWKNEIVLGFTSGHMQILNVPRSVSEGTTATAASDNADAPLLNGVAAV